jgi:DNA-binding MarR family transcriptional regulator
MEMEFRLNTTRAYYHLMDEEEVVLSRETLKAVSADTRISILKALLERQKTQSELAAELKLSAPTVLEHVSQLEKARLIELVPEYADKKWKYYRLTRTGRSMVEGRKMSIVLVLANSSAILTAGLIGVFILLGLLSSMSPLSSAPPPLTSSSGGQHLASALTSLDSSPQFWIGLAIMLLLVLTLILYAAYFISTFLAKRKKSA